MRIGLSVLLSTACLGLLGACARQPMLPPVESGASTPAASITAVTAQADRGAPFVGLWLGNAEQGGAEVLGMVAGPAAMAGVQQGDRILRIGDVEVDAPRAVEIFAASSPGTQLLLHLMRGDKPVELELVVDARERWAGPAARPAAEPFAATQLSTAAESPDPAIAAALAEAPEAVALNQRLDRMFAELARDDAGFNKLPLIRSALLRPGSMIPWREKLIGDLREPQGDSGRSVGAICETLALTCPTPRAAPAADPVSISAFSAAIAAGNLRVREVFRLAGVDRAEAFADIRYLLEKVATDRTLLRQSEVLRGIRAMQTSMKIDLAALLSVADDLLANAQRLPPAAAVARKPPAALAAMVQGDIVDFAEVDGGFVVIGGAGPNRYDMGRLYAVIDLGGDDVYRWGDGVPLETQTLIDLAGDDRYQAATGGPGGGWLGVSVLIDRSGDDGYESALGGCAAGALGFGFLFDVAGADTYRCAAWSIGAGLYGAGLLVDSGADTDVYLSQAFSQGVGGPRGFGVLLDAGGADLYRANGPVPSAYDTPGSFMAFSQGVGVGIRPYDTGGVGVLLDLAGNDRYEGGEFSQGGGYYWGVGLLHDAAGNELYYGNRYAQGFAAHQAFGMLSDLAGDDVYWSMTAAGQGAAWDQSIAMLFDGGGDDTYRAQALSQGAAAQQARASLHDVAGNDVYWASNDVAQGVAGDNSYHFARDDPIFSLGLLLDDAGADRYSSGLGNGDTRLRAVVEGVENGRGVAGLAIDRP